MKRTLKGILSTILLSATIFLGLNAGECPLKSGDKLAFMGDSITQQGFKKSAGYVNLVMIGLKHKGLDVQLIPAGVSGHKSNQMLARVESDVIKKGATWMTFSCGVNDVWHGKNGVPLDQFKENVTKLFDKADKAGVKVMVLTATMISEDPKAENNIKLADYNDFLRKIAKERGYLLADLNADMQKIVIPEKAKNPKRWTILTADGVHMNLSGDKMMASGILRAFGFTEAEIVEIDCECWQNIPNAHTVSFGVSEKEYKALQKKAEEAGVPVNQYVHQTIFPQK